MTTTYKVTVEDNGETRWFLDGRLHRNDGPAYINSAGEKAWYQNGNRHREDGPAIKYAGGHKSWYLNGVNYTKEDFYDKLNPARELTVAEISELLGYEVKIVK